MSTSLVVCLGLWGFEALFGVLREEAGPGETATLTELWVVPSRERLAGRQLPW
ncbi:hypothetical protein [Streptomyces sp. NBC_01481]|uniref:hypothetical protein n=1 Tax=Streptomyces sp. NBC_01481 TaxID=2975869 RepID=UPI00224FB6F9|nr:hypothetical protein [Streptomyces sp. NBC_01481]MCX4585797.1 hypothetical protein [Streptomyces sp. NBC_01481]